ncbi:Uncharacterized conserved protein YabE, contains G5 and tandem DUF348 domains [Clostridium sp. USBA 49]|jgi:uncharacterized protein YabE (DUF348 family)|uniref:3D domain-containing protein n=1 Tax=Clostridium TaxID=1485 RepID=UPI000999ADA3|nr:MULTISPECIES: 3D domain-containing protein [Clostridium]SKA82751.1 Uncharacterized conserved protein YabE, contains G5 and tandem DUF348 domains [Clostridium sp. USBA 49]
MNNLKNTFNNCFSNGFKTIFILLLMLMGSIISLDTAKKTVIVSIDGKETKIVTFKKTFKDALESNNIVLGPKDKTTPSLDNVLKKNNKINIKKAVNINIAVDGQNLNIKTAEDTVEEVLKTEGIIIKDSDKISPSKDVPIVNGLKLVVTRVESKVIEETKPIDFSTVVKNDKSFEKGKTKIVQEGEKGELVTTTNVIYEDGKEVERKVISEKVKKEPVPKIIATGTKEPNISLAFSRGGSGLNKKTSNKLENEGVKTAFTVQSTAYTADFKSTGKNPGDSGFGITSTGTRAKRDPNGYSTIAVDPRIIPYGTKLYIEGYGYAIAEDTGGAIKGRKIDVFFNTNRECMQWGRRNVKVYILE